MFRQKLPRNCLETHKLMSKKKMETPVSLGSGMEGNNTEPAAVGLDAGGREFLGLELVLQDLPLAVALGPAVVHLETPHRSGGAALPITAPALAVAAVHVQGVLRLPGDPGRPLLLLRHVPSSGRPVGQAGGRPHGGN